MTGGKTANGLRYPLGDEPDYSPPAHLQNLAEDIDNKVRSVGAAVTFATWIGTATFSTATVLDVPFPTIRWVRGAIVSRHTFAGGSALPALPLVIPEWARQQTWDQFYWNKVRLFLKDPASRAGSAGQLYPNYFIGTAGLCVLAWGDPNPPGG